MKFLSATPSRQMGWEFHPAVLFVSILLISGNKQSTRIEASRALFKRFDFSFLGSSQTLF